jgi:hypothetical protein
MPTTRDMANRLALDTLNATLGFPENSASAKERNHVRSLWRLPAPNVVRMRVNALPLHLPVFRSEFFGPSGQHVPRRPMQWNASRGAYRATLVPYRSAR